MVVRIYPDNPNERAIAQVVEILRNDGVIIYPTDSVYAFGCSLESPKAIDRMRVIANKVGHHFALVCSDLSVVANYAKVDTPTFKLMKRNLPGPFTFILAPSGRVPNKYLDGRRQVGIRIPDHAIAQAIVAELGCPLVTTSVKDPGLETEYTTDPSLLYEHYADRIDLMVDGGYGLDAVTTVVDYSAGDPVLLREGIGELEE